MGAMPGVFGLQTGDVMAASLCADGDRKDPADGSILECKCFEGKKGAR